MGSESFETFFLAAAGAGGAFIGLLFVAISIGPQRTFGDSAAVGALRQFLAEAALVTLVNGFVVSSIALIPGVNVGWVALAGGVWGTATAAYLAWRFAQFHRHGAERHRHWGHLLRVTSLSLVGTIVYAVEVVFGFRLILQPGEESAFRGLGVGHHGALRAGHVARLDAAGRSAARLERLAQSVAGPRSRKRDPCPAGPILVIPLRRPPLIHGPRLARYGSTRRRARPSCPAWSGDGGAGPRRFARDSDPIPHRRARARCAR